ncbi:MAG: hypothetical protein MAGBODY4_00054 [Candidatus Marinimicrobia bacterium]|nr:hypothetical protein [Candidatus Neomarinimicrobiota bacterium]
MRIWLTIVFCILFLFSSNTHVFGQPEVDSAAFKQGRPKLISTGIALYWKTMSTEEKNTFLTGYLMSHYDVLRKFDKSIESANNNIGEIKSNLEQTVAYFRINSYDERQRFIELIDQYYKRKIHASGSFADALRYAHRILQYEMSDSTQTQ